MKPWEVKAYKTLACAIIRQAVEDYVHRQYSDYEFYNFLFNTTFIKCLDIDPEFIYEQAVKKRERMKDGKERHLSE